MFIQEVLLYMIENVTEIRKLWQDAKNVGNKIISPVGQD